MIERLFFDGVDLDGGRRGIAEAVKFAASIDANKAEPSLAFPNVTVARTEITVDFAGGVGFPPAGFAEGFGRFHNLKRFHDGDIPSDTQPTLGSGAARKRLS